MSSSRMLRRVIAVVTVFSLVAPLNPALAAWAPPSSGPTGGNPNGPITTGSSAQGRTGALGVGTVSPNASSIVDVSTTTKGVLLPRMTTAQRNAIASPANGLTVYNTDTKTLERYDNTASPGCTPNPSCHWGLGGLDGPAFTVRGATGPTSFDGNSRDITFGAPDLDADPCDATCVGGASAWGYLSGGRFKPSVAGNYFLSGNITYIPPSSAGTIYLRLLKNGLIAAEQSQSYNTYETGGLYRQLGIAVVVNASSGDTFSLQVYVNSASVSHVSGYSYFSGSRIGGPVSLTNTTYQNNINGTAAAGQVAYFNGPSTVAGNSKLTFNSTSGNLTLGGNTLVTSGSSQQYGGITIQNLRSGYNGINFKDAAGGNQKTLMINSTYSGIFNAADSAWDWYWNNGTLEQGTVPAANISGTVANATYAASAGSASTANYANTAGNGTPSGMVGMFWSAACPAGWNYLNAVVGDQVLGKYPIVAWPGTYAHTVGTPVIPHNYENRATGDHTHPVTPTGYVVNVSNQTQDRTVTTPYYGGGMIALPGVASGGTGNAPGTNAPYISFTFCYKY